MILGELVKYYEILTQDEDSTIPRVGYSRAGVAYALNISPDGELLNILPLKVEEKRGKKTVEVSRSMEVPEQAKKTVGIISNFLCENAIYIFGFDKNGVSERTQRCFEAFKKLHNEILKDVDCEEARAVINYVNKWDVQNAESHPALQNYMKDIVSGANFVFRMPGKGFVHENPKIKKRWLEYHEEGEQGQIMQCLVTGQKTQIARLHQSIKGVKNAQSSGASLVSFNARAYESYGRDNQQGLNAPVGKYAAFAYGTALNYLLADTEHKMFLGDMTVVFWAQSREKKYIRFIGRLINADDEIKNNDAQDVEMKNDDEAAREIKAVFDKIGQGKPIAELSGAFDESTRFNILGLSPNASRLAVRFFVTDSFGGFVDNVAKHYIDMQIEPQYKDDKKVFSVWRLLNETVSPKARDKSANPLLAGSVLRSIITGGRYPAALFQFVMLRIRAEKDINYCKVAIIKGYLTRNSKEKFKEVLTMALNENSDNSAYVLGRLFAVLESIQLDANRGINTTIKDRYFSSACATPAAVFPTLLRLAQNHISKANYGKAGDKRIENILAKLDIETNPIPAHLTLEQQGVFVLGYYHQRNALYKTNKDTEEEVKS